ncbi:MAG: DUF1104 domain-containing protein [Sulfuricurvum sp.]|nr:DUF1104 domain-containing protein [Sulfuricurvum sp.]MDD5386113.1 DUF1104 domain-containing protein [Sulfuricurvum sp.]
MKKIILALFFSSVVVFATDYSGKSLEEMKTIRSTLSWMELPSFRAEMQKRMKNMTPQERQKLQDEMKQSK